MTLPARVSDFYTEIYKAENAEELQAFIDDPAVYMEEGELAQELDESQKAIILGSEATIISTIETETGISPSQMVPLRIIKF